MIVFIIALEVLAILANLALPMTQDAALRGRATTIAREMQQVREASLKALAGRDEWSPQPAVEAPPPEVTAALPNGFAFSHDDYRIVWERWSVADPEVLGLRQRNVAAVTVIAADPRLAALVAKAIPAGEIRYTIGDHTTLVVQ